MDWRITSNWPLPFVLQSLLLICALFNTSDIILRATRKKLDSTQKVLEKTALMACATANRSGGIYEPPIGRWRRTRRLTSGLPHRRADRGPEPHSRHLT